MLLKKMKMADEISDEEFTTQVSKCVATLSESQECMALLVRKIWNTHSVWKSQKKVSFNIASYGAKYVYILSGQKFIKNAKNWSILANFRKH